MSHVSIRFNKRRGEPGWGTVAHVWRVFCDGKEYRVKHCRMEVPTYSEADINGNDFNIACDGMLVLERETSTAVVREVSDHG